MKEKKAISRGKVRTAFKTAVPYTIPIFTGFWLLGLTYGVLMNVSGFSFVYPTCMAAVIFGGSLEFVAVTMLLSPFAPVHTLIMALIIQARHLFYGISMLGRYRGMGWKKPVLIYGMCDETFSINHSAEIPDDVDKGWFYLFVTLLNWFYWVSGSAIGGLAGSLIHFNTDGLGFVMTAMFVVILLEQFLKEQKHWTTLIGFLSGGISLAVFGPDKFMIPTMLAIILLLTIFRRPVEGSVENPDEKPNENNTDNVNENNKDPVTRTGAPLGKAGDPS